MQILRTIGTQHRARVALYNRLFVRSIVSLCSGVGGKIPPWGKGLSHTLRKTGIFEDVSKMGLLLIIIHILWIDAKKVRKKQEIKIPLRQSLSV